jgi:hypothetical protein
MFFKVTIRLNAVTSTRVLKKGMLLLSANNEVEPNIEILKMITEIDCISNINNNVNELLRFNISTSNH